MVEHWKSAPATVRWAAVGIAEATVGHFVALAVPPHPIADLYHVISGPLYGWLGVMVLRGRNWARVAITVLLVVQSIGRLHFATGAAWVRVANAIGWPIALAVIVLLWWPAASRRHFGAAQASPAH